MSLAEESQSLRNLRKQLFVTVFIVYFCHASVNQKDILTQLIITFCFLVDIAFSIMSTHNLLFSQTTQCLIIYSTLMPEQKQLLSNFCATRPTCQLAARLHSTTASNSSCLHPRTTTNFLTCLGLKTCYFWFKFILLFCFSTFTSSLVLQYRLFFLIQILFLC